MTRKDLQSRLRQKKNWPMLRKLLVPYLMPDLMPISKKRYLKKPMKFGIVFALVAMTTEIQQLPLQNRYLVHAANEPGLTSSVMNTNLKN